MRRRATAVLILLLASAIPRAVKSDEQADDCRALFTIRRNNSRNELIYEACFSGAAFSGQPIRAHWMMGDSDGHREEMTGLEERFAYGTIVKAALPDSVSFGVRALPARELVARRDGDEIHAFTQIDGRMRALVGVYIEVGPGFIFPSVHSVDLIGRDEEGATRIERLTP